ncbi:MAG: ATP-binding protein [Nibricoccus sp.]
MSFTVKLNQLRRSVAVRLSLWFTLLFAAGFTAIFALLYFLLGRQLEARELEALRMRLQQYADIYEAHGIRGLNERIDEDSDTPHVRSIYARLVSPQGDIVWGRVPPDWIDQDERRVAIPDGWGGWTIRKIYGVRIPRDEQRDLMVVSAQLSNGLLLQVGRSTDNRAALLEPLRRVFIWIGSVAIILGFGISAYAARRATRPLHQVVETARRIINAGALDARVLVPPRDDDIAELVRHFNTVLDKNAALLRSMREALDNVAHDLRTPLTSMRGAAELALSQPTVDPAAREALADCVERSDEVLRLLRALMEISEAEAGMLRLDRTEEDLRTVVAQAADLYADVAEAKQISLKLEEGSAVPVFVDKVRLRQAVANLIDNAIKYTPDGGSVTLRVNSENGTAFLSVRDTGPGVPEAEQPRIWERLYRGDQSRSQTGLGLGLSLVKAIVDAHGGAVTMHNAPGGGSIFEVGLPTAPKPDRKMLPA